MFDKKLFIYFSKTHLYIFHRELTTPLKLELDPSTVQDLERIKIDWLRTNLDQLLEKINLKNYKGILILSKDLVFDKIINEESTEDKNKETLEFIEHIPLSNNLIAHKEFIKDGNTLITATNIDLYKILIELFSEHGIDIEYVLPEIVFNKIDFNKKFLSDLFNEKDLLRYGNFLEGTSSNKKSDFKFILLVILIVISLGILIGFGASYLNQNKGSLDTTLQNIDEFSPTLEATITNASLTSPSSIENPTLVGTTAPVIKKDTIKVFVYNGTGIPGFAGQISKLLTDKGFKTPETTNADKFDYTNTIIEVSADFSDSLISEVRDALKSDLKSFEIKKNLQEINTIKIITGEAIKN